MPARIIPRAAWGARRPKTTPVTVPVSARSATCVHHAGATPVNVSTVAEAYAYVRADQNYHMDSKGWADIGYNFLVMSAPGTPVDGMILEGRGRDVLGAHCLGWNQPWIGVQVATGGTARGDQRPSPAALASVRWLHDGFGIAARHVLGMKAHCDGFATECPGPILLAWVRSGMPASVQSGSASPWPSPAKPPAPTKQPHPSTGALHVNVLNFSHVTTSTPTWVRGSGVAPLQRLLSIRADGIGGPATRAALHTYQASHALAPDAIFGPATATALLAGR